MIKLGSNLNSQKGFTLPEVLVSTFIFAGVTAICLALLLAGTNAWKNNKVQNELQGETRKAMEWIKEDLRQSGVNGISNVPADGSNYTTITFQEVTGVTNGSAIWSASNFVYALSGTDLQRTANGSTRTVAQNIQSLQFKRLLTTPNLLEVSLTAQGTTDGGRIITIASTVDVRLRN